MNTNRILVERWHLQLDFYESAVKLLLMREQPIPVHKTLQSYTPLIFRPICTNFNKEMSDKTPSRPSEVHSILSQIDQRSPKKGYKGGIQQREHLENLANDSQENKARQIHGG